MSEEDEVLMSEGLNYEEGDECPECGEGKLYYPQVENCTCHVAPPCQTCLDVALTCDKCGAEAGSAH